LVEAGIFLNMLGYGAVLPFEVIYLHDGRGFSLATAGIVVGTVTGVAVVAAPAAGRLIDGLGARTTGAVAGIALAGGYAGLAFAVTPLQALAAALLAGIGNGALGPAQSSLIAALAPPEIRHRATAVSRVAANAGMGLGAAAGGLVAVRGLDGYVALFLANALTYLVYVGVLVAMVHGEPPPERLAGGYRRVLADRAFVHLALLNVAMIAAGWGAFTWLLPPYASGLGIGAREIGLLLLANAATVVVVQVPVARLAEGRRRVTLIALAGLLFAGACALVVAAHGYALLLVAVILVAVGECLHTTALMPLVADLAAPALRGRYMATVGLSWWIGLALAPTVGGRVLSASPSAAFVAAAALALGAAASTLSLERRLPARARLTPRPSAAPGR
jgi:MFS family permease